MKRGTAFGLGVALGLLLGLWVGSVLDVAEVLRVRLTPPQPDGEVVA